MSNNLELSYVGLGGWVMKSSDFQCKVWLNLQKCYKSGYLGYEVKLFVVKNII